MEGSEKLDKLNKMRNLDPVGFFKSTKKIIEQMTKVTSKHVLTPGLRLRLVTNDCELWNVNYQECEFVEPFWAFYWPGGEALTRYLLDNKEIIKSKSVLDVGSGCGSLAIAAAKLGGAKSITANDIDPVAAVAIELNANLNDCDPKGLQIVTDNLIGTKVPDDSYDCIFLGDMFYNEEFNDKLSKWLLMLVNNGADVFIGDPKRKFKVFDDIKDNIELVAEYTVPDLYKEENGLDDNKINVWKMSAKLS